MSNVFGTSNSKQLSIEAVVFPACECGESWTSHGDCGGYRPSKPLVNHGTIHFVSTDAVANWLFAIERFFQRLRVARLRSL